MATISQFAVSEDDSEEVQVLKLMTISSIGQWTQKCM